MDTRVIKIRLENAIKGNYSDEYFRQQMMDLLTDIREEIETSDRTIDSGMVSSVVDDLRIHYFTYLNEYSAMPKTFGTLVKRANVLDDLMITLSKIIGYISFAITRNASSTDPSIQRVCAVLKPELESYKKELYNLGSLMQNLIMDKKIYVEKLKEKNEQ